MHSVRGSEAIARCVQALRHRICRLPLQHSPHLHEACCCISTILAAYDMHEGRRRNGSPIRTALELNAAALPPLAGPWWRELTTTFSSQRNDSLMRVHSTKPIALHIPMSTCRSPTLTISRFLSVKGWVSRFSNGSILVSFSDRLLLLVAFFVGCCLVFEKESTSSSRVDVSLTLPLDL